MILKQVSLTSLLDGANAATDVARNEQTMTENFMIDLMLLLSNAEVKGSNLRLLRLRLFHSSTSFSISLLKAIDTRKIASLKHHSGSVKLLKSKHRSKNYHVSIFKVDRK